jgi:2'-5' RNA ligase
VSSRPLETAITLVLEDQDEALAEAHRELYPERIAEAIPFTLTLLYPWIPAESVTDADLEELRAFFAARPPLEFELTHVAEFPGLVVYPVPEPDAELRTTMRALWTQYPEYPPYREPDSDPPPHATLGRLVGPSPTSLEAARKLLEGLLPVRCDVREVALMEEHALDRMRIREIFPFGG